jgi:hypothetical protein
VRKAAGRGNRGSSFLPSCEEWPTRCLADAQLARVNSIDFGSPIPTRGRIRASAVALGPPFTTDADVAIMLS